MPPSAAKLIVWVAFTTSVAVRVFVLPMEPEQVSFQNSLTVSVMVWVPVKVVGDVWMTTPFNDLD